jgi:sugar phosphate isomerase/epimerase
MKTSALLFLTEIMPEKRRLYGAVIKNKVFNGRTREHVFQTLKKAGIDGVEILLPQFSEVSDKELTDLKELLATYHMPVLSLHQKLRFFTKTKITEVTQLFHQAELLGAKVIVLHMSSVGKQLFDKSYIEKLHDLQEKYGIMIGFENREKQFWNLTNKEGWDADSFPEILKKNNLHLTLDTTHLAQAGGDIIQFFKKNKDRIVNIHISDYKDNIFNNSIRPFRYKHLPLGKGRLPMKEFIDLLHKEEYKGLVTMEIHTDLDGICDGAKKIKNEEKN